MNPGLPRPFISMFNYFIGVVILWLLSLVPLIFAILPFCVLNTPKKILKETSHVHEMEIQLLYHVANMKGGISLQVKRIRG